MESEENEASYASSLESHYGNRQRSEESATVLSVETHPTVSQRSRSSLEADGSNIRISQHHKSEEGGLVHSPSRKSSLSSALKFSRHFANSNTDFVEEDNVSYSDTFDLLDSLSETEDETSKTVHETSRSNRSNSDGDLSISSSNRSSCRQLISYSDEEISIDRLSKSLIRGADDTAYCEEEDARSFSDGPEWISDGEGGIRSLTPAAMEENNLSSLGLLSNSSIWSPAGSISDLNITDHSIEDKFTSADGEIIYYSDFSLEALTARQYTQRSDISEWSQNLRNDTVVSKSAKLEEFFQKKIRLLRRQSSSDEKEAPPVFSIRSRNTGKIDLKEVAESVDLKVFCSKKLHHLKNQHTDSGECKSFSSGLPNFYEKLKDDTDVLTYGIPLSAIQRLRVDRKAMIDFHEPSACDRCRQELGQLGQSEFVLSKMAIIRERLTNLKLDDARNSSMYGMKIFGEILEKASCLCRQPELLMQRLLEPLAVHRTDASTITQTV